MMARLASLFGSKTSDDLPTVATVPFSQCVETLNNDPYLLVADADLQLISVFDDLRYDRSDLDMVSAPMRKRALAKLTPMGFSQTSGSVFENRSQDVRVHLPKFKALGASPFDALRDTQRRPQDYALLTPTQAAAQIIAENAHEKAVERLKVLVVKLPVNLLRLVDFLEPLPRHQAFEKAVGHLMYLQRDAISKEPLKTRRALR